MGDTSKVGDSGDQSSKVTASGGPTGITVEVPKFSPQGFAHPISNKLDENNYLTWRMQVVATVKGYNLYQFLVGGKHVPLKFLTDEDAESDSVNPEFLKWECQDQIIMSWLLDSMTPTMTNKMVGCSPLSEHEQIETVLDGLPSEYEGFITSLTMKNETPTILEVEALLLSQESRLEALKGSSDNISANITQTKANSSQSSNSLRPPSFSSQQQFPSFRPNFSRGGQGRGRGRNNNRGRGPWQPTNSQFNNRPLCQVCGRAGHIAIHCYHRFDQANTAATLAQAQSQYQYGRGSSNPPPSTQTYTPQVEALVAAPETLYDAAWYPDSGASHHITNDASNLHSHQPYTGSEQVHAANGTGLVIHNVGQSEIHTNSSKILSLKNLFHVPSVTKNLLSVSKCAQDNNVYFEFHPDFCVVKSQDTNQVLLKGRMSKGLYLFDELTLGHKASDSNSVHALNASNSSSKPLSLWHCRMGHPSQQIVKSALSSCNLKYINNTDFNSFCEPCCMGKSHSISFPSSQTVYTQPLELVFSDLWGLAPVVSSRGFRYYIVFIDAYSRFSWLYLLKSKSDAFSAFKQFRMLAEKQLNTSLRTFQSDFGGCIRFSNSSILLTNLISSTPITTLSNQHSSNANTG
ncbi:Retrovirus-related Pol polyprotein from transposon TNT 1-94 [Senna tora]|uniref:Retrovirus-related Pol polyprotein from transposon TNT 1-94 n=1 Tax=Senna tora TaxID=362788 RepID=A0A834WYN7_9FABA|nr:Retrovirus-related Pol polyprotein from transposon TNT 1-94 [Senna tora]